MRAAPGSQVGGAARGLRRRSLLATLGGIWLAGHPAPADTPASLPASRCPCGLVAYFYVLKEHGVDLSKVATPAQPADLHALAELLRARGLRADVVRLTPSELFRSRDTVVVTIVEEGLHRPHFETVVGHNGRQGIFAAPAFLKEGHLILRELDRLAEYWDGQALVVSRADRAAGWWGQTIRHAVPAGCALLAGWLVASGALRLRRRVRRVGPRGVGVG